MHIRGSGTSSLQTSGDESESFPENCLSSSFLRKQLPGRQLPGAPQSGHRDRGGTKASGVPGGAGPPAPTLSLVTDEALRR